MYRLTVCVFLAAFNWIGPAVAAPVYWDPAVGGNGHYYALVEGSDTWHSARDRASEISAPAGYKPGHLATIANSAEDRFLRETFFHHAGAFFGFTDEVIEGNWQWIDDTPGIWQDPAFFASPTQTAFTSWGVGEPNNYLGDEDYAQYGWSDKPRGVWNDATAYLSASLVEWEPVNGPRVTGVKVSGLTWIGGAHGIPFGSDDQLLPLPWTRTNQVSVDFSENVTFDGQMATLVDGGGNEYALFGPTLSPGDEPGTLRASWQLEEFLDSGRYTLRLDDGILNGDNLPLDGDWTDGTSGVSGDGAPGGDFVFTFNVLAGDVNQDGIVNLFDLIEIRNGQGTSVGGEGYSLLNDIDTRGTITIADVQLAGGRLFDTLPTTAAASAAAVPEPSTSAIFAAGALLLVARCVGRQRCASAP